MDAFEANVAGIAAAIGEPARARMLFCLMDGCARTSTELSVVADVSPSTASAHLMKLKDARLVTVTAQGKHRYYGLNGPEVARALEELANLAGGTRPEFVPTTPSRLRSARTCYDHAAGQIGVMLHDALLARGWLRGSARESDYELTSLGAERVVQLGVDLDGVRGKRRRFAYPCLDWSERRPHLGGALGAAILDACLKRKWLSRDLDSRALTVTSTGRRELACRFGTPFSWQED